MLLSLLARRGVYNTYMKDTAVVGLGGGGGSERACNAVNEHLHVHFTVNLGLACIKYKNPYWTYIIVP
jgi:hypothetical protein